MILFILAYYAIQALMLLIFVTSLLSWFNPNPRNPVVRLLRGIVDPLLHPIQTILPAGLGMDFSPIVAILVLWLLQNLLQRGFAS